MSNFTSMISVLLLLGGLAAAALLLRRYRDRLAGRFNQGPIALRGILNVGDGSRLILVEVDGTTILCGIGRNGVGAMQTISQTSPTGSDQ